MRLYGLIGFPLAHSFSKRFFTEKFEQELLTDCRYELFPLESIELLPQLLENQPGLKGLNVTIPYKKAVIPYLHSIADLPSGLDSCNCIRIEDGLLYGFNTDVIGFEKSINPLLKGYHQTALILGNGGSTVSVGFVLKKLGIPFHIVSRKIHDGATLTYDQIDEEVITNHKLIINTTPLGMHPNADQCPAIPYQYITPEHLLFDLIYNPSLTEFLRKGKEKGARIMNGLEMLEIQAEESWKIWNEKS